MVMMAGIQVWVMEFGMMNEQSHLIGDGLDEFEFKWNLGWRWFDLNGNGLVDFEEPYTNADGQ